jgi:hypothetical protein
LLFGHIVSKFHQGGQKALVGDQEALYFNVTYHCLAPLYRCHALRLSLALSPYLCLALRLVVALHLDVA